MELFQLRVPAGAGRAFTPSRGSMVVLTHVALTCEGPKRASKDERITVQVATRGGGGDGKTDAIALGSVSDAPGREQFAIGGSGLCFGDGERVVVSHNGREARRRALHDYASANLVRATAPATKAATKAAMRLILSPLFARSGAGASMA